MQIWLLAFFFFFARQDFLDESATSLFKNHATCLYCIVRQPNTIVLMCLLTSEINVQTDIITNINELSNDVIIFISRKTRIITIVRIEYLLISTTCIKEK